MIRRTLLNTEVRRNQATLPTWVPADVRNGYDPLLNVYNLKPSNTRRLRAGLGRARTGGLCEISIIGASHEQGHNGGAYDRLRAWPLQMRDQLGVPTAGTGMVRLLDRDTADARWGYTGAWSGGDKTYSSLASAGTATFTTDKAGDKAVVFYYDNNPTAASFTVHVNGVLKSTVTNTGPAGWKSVTVTENIAVGQTVLITWVSGTILISGVSVWSSTGGLLINNCGQSGSLASGTGQEAWGDSSAAIRLGQVYATATTSLAVPDLVMIDLGHNDKLASASDATIASALTTIRNRWSSSDAILIAGTALSGVTDAAWEAYIGSLYTLADTLDVPLIDFRDRLGTWSQIDAANLEGDTVAHLKVEAHADLGSNVAQILGGISRPELVRRSTINAAEQSLTASSANRITGTSVALPTKALKVGSRFKFEVGVIKTAAGTATWSLILKFGTLNTTSDAAIATWTSGTNTAAIDQAHLTIEMEVLTLGATATAKCICISSNTLTNVTGLGRIEFVPGSTATFNSDADRPFLHVDITPGASAVMTAVGAAQVL